ncbi:MAG: phosphate ABC transporter substrate-binding protein PstS, partial [Bdellovibrionales bacterium]|nr:phosphate ABC transporter substrate-binding protein PstS [Bdellovibrionales bacterium]
ATFPYPIYTKWVSEFKKENPGVDINYQPVGSGGGIRQLVDKTVDFGASDAPMSDDQLAKAAGKILHIPTVLGAVVITYNVPGVTGSVKITPEVLADIYLGKISLWSDARLKADNPGITFPEKLSILVVYRSDGSGTTAVMTDYLSKVAPTFKEKVGQGTAVRWPVGLGGKGNEGVTGLVKNTKGGLGYVELVYAETNKLPVAQIKNKAGEFVAPAPESVMAAAEGVLKTIPDDFRVSLTNADGKKAYPISALTYLLVYQEMKKEKGAPLIQFLKWALSKGQSFAKPLSYAALPSALQKKVEERIKTIQLKD